MWRENWERLMFQQLRIKNFRLFGELEVGGLSRINLLAGRNNSGKTTVLEGLFLLCGGGNPELVLRITTFRGVNQVPGPPSVVPAAYWKPLFSDLDMNRHIEISGSRTTGDSLELTIAPERSNTVKLIRGPVELSSGQLRGATVKFTDAQVLRTSGELSETLRLTFAHGNDQHEGRLSVTQDGFQIVPPEASVPLQAVFVSARSGSLQEDAVRLGQLRTRKQGDLLTNALRIVEPRLQSVEDSAASGIPMLWGDIGLPQMVPLSAMGEGMIRIARLVLAISAAPGGLVLVDEIENGIHHSILDKVWAAAAEAARQFNTQVFATTHSFECVAAAHKAVGTDQWRYYRLDRTSDGVRCVSYNPEDVEASVRHGMEVR